MNLNVDQFFQKLTGRVARQEKVAAITAIAVGLVSHVFIFSNRIMFHDDASANFNLGSTVSSGRYILEIWKRILDHISQNATTSWFNGMISLCLIGTAAALLVRNLKIQSKVFSGLVGALIASYPAVAATFSYMFTAPIYFFSLLLMVVAVELADKGRIYQMIIAAGCIGISLGIYQAYISFYVTIVLLILVNLFLDNKKSSQAVWKSVGAYGVTFGAGIVMYLICNRAFTKLFGGVNQYSNIALKNIPSALAEAYRMFGQLLMGEYYGIAPYNILRGIYCVMVAVSVVLFGIWLKKVQAVPAVRKIISGILFILLPIGINFVYVITLNNVEIHSLMLGAAVFVLIIPCTLISRLTDGEGAGAWTNSIAIGIAVLMGVGCFLNCKVDNVAYQSAYWSQQQAREYCAELITRIQQTEGYEKNMPVAFLNFEKMDDPNLVDENEFKTKLTTLDFSAKDILTDWSYIDFIKFQCGFSPEWKGNPRPEDSSQPEYIANMPSYPDEGAIAVIDGVVLVKFAD